MEREGWKRGYRFDYRVVGGELFIRKGEKMKEIWFGSLCLRRNARDGKK